MKKAFPFIGAAGLAAVILFPGLAHGADGRDGAIGPDTLAFYLGRQADDGHGPAQRFLPGSVLTRLNDDYDSGRWIVLQPSFPAPDFALLASQRFTTGPDAPAGAAFMDVSPPARENSPSSLLLTHGAENQRMSFTYDSTAPAGADDSPGWRLGAKGGARLSADGYYAASEVTYNHGYPEAALVSGSARKGMDISVEAGRRLDALSAGLLYTYKTGDGIAAGENSLAAPRSASSPFYIFSPAQKGEKVADDSLLDNAHAVFFYAGYELNDHLNIRGALGFAKLEKTPAAPDALPLRESRWGLEFGATYKFLDNLIYEAHLGYANSTDLFVDPAEESAAGLDNPHIYQIINQLTMTF